MRCCLSSVTFLAALVWAAPTVRAQHSDNGWLDRCRAHQDDSERPRYCEERTIGEHAPGGTITVDGGENGGATLAGWDRDSIDVIAHIETSARTGDEARALARAAVAPH